MALCGSIIPLNGSTVISILEQEEAHLVHKFLKERLSFKEELANKLIVPISQGNVS